VEKFASPVADTGEKFATGVTDTGAAPWLANISANFRKILNDPNVIFRVWGKMFQEKHLKKKISWHYPFNLPLYQGTHSLQCGGNLGAFLGRQAFGLVSRKGKGHTVGKKPSPESYKNLHFSAKYVTYCTSMFITRAGKERFPRLCYNYKRKHFREGLVSSLGWDYIVACYHSSVDKSIHPKSTVCMNEYMHPQ
jgi:hypothetical protein